MARVENAGKQYTVGELVLVTVGGKDIATQILAIITSGNYFVRYTVNLPNLGLVDVPYEQIKPIAK